MNVLKKMLRGASAFILILGLWQIAASMQIFNAWLFPTPHQTWNALAELVTQDHLYLQIGASMTRYLTGYLIAAVLAVVLGLLHGWFAASWDYVNPLVQFLRPISPIAWMPFIVLWFGIGDVPAEVVIFIAAFFPILLSTVSAVRHIDPVYRKVAANFSFGTMKTITKIVFPAAFPQIMDGFRMACGTAWIFLVAGEMVGAQSGLGFLIVDARNNLRVDILAAVILVIGLLGLAIDLFMHYLEDRVRDRWGLGISKSSR